MLLCLPERGNGETPSLLIRLSHLIKFTLIDKLVDEKQGEMDLRPEAVLGIILLAINNAPSVILSGYF